MPQLVLWAFPDWFAGFCFSAIALGALVPAAVMSIGAANTFTRNVWKPFIHPQMTPLEESVVAKLVSLIVKVGALMVIFFMPTQFALDLQLLGGVWMVQIFPALVFGLFTRWWSGWALSAGRLASWLALRCRGREGLGAVTQAGLGHSVRWPCRQPRPRRLQRPDRGDAELAGRDALSLVMRSKAPDETHRRLRGSSARLRHRSKLARKSAFECVCAKGAWKCGACHGPHPVAFVEGKGLEG